MNNIINYAILVTMFLITSQKIANRIEYATPTDRNIPLNKTTEEKRKPEICNWCFSKMVGVPYP